MWPAPLKKPPQPVLSAPITLPTSCASRNRPAARSRRSGYAIRCNQVIAMLGGSLTRNHGLIVAREKAGDQRHYSIKA
jgi:hypothetical protein